MIWDGNAAAWFLLLLSLVEWKMVVFYYSHPLYFTLHPLLPFLSPSPPLLSHPSLLRQETPFKPLKKNYITAHYNSILISLSLPKPSSFGIAKCLEFLPWNCRILFGFYTMKVWFIVGLWGTRDRQFGGDWGGGCRWSGGKSWFILLLISYVHHHGYQGIGRLPFQRSRWHDLQLACNEALVWARIGLPTALELADFPTVAFNYDIGRFIDATTLAKNYGKSQSSGAGDFSEARRCSNSHISPPSVSYIIAPQSELSLSFRRFSCETSKSNHRDVWVIVWFDRSGEGYDLLWW